MILERLFLRGTQPCRGLVEFCFFNFTNLVLLHEVEIILKPSGLSIFVESLWCADAWACATHRSCLCGCQTKKGPNRLYFEWLRCRGIFSRPQKHLQPARPCWKAAAWKVIIHGANGWTRSMRGCWQLWFITAGPKWMLLGARLWRSWLV